MIEDKKALIGLLLHEITHTIQAERRLYTHVSKNFMKTLIARMQERKFKPAEEKLLIRVGFTSVLFLKDLYVNHQLIRDGFGDYLLANYSDEFESRRVCPKPLFYANLSKEVKKDPLLLYDLFQFQFALLSILMPFEKINNERAKKLKKYIERCYQINVKKIVESCRDIEKLLFNEEAESDEFQMKFFNMVIDKVVSLME